MVGCFALSCSTSIKAFLTEHQLIDCGCTDAGADHSWLSDPLTALANGKIFVSHTKKIVSDFLKTDKNSSMPKTSNCWLFMRTKYINRQSMKQPVFSAASVLFVKSACGLNIKVSVQLSGIKRVKELEDFQGIDYRPKTL